MPKPIHIMQVLHTLEIGGAEKLVYDIAKNFDSSFKFSFCCLDSLGYLGNLLIEEGNDVYCLGRKEGVDLSVVKKMSALFTRNDVDIVQAHQYTPYFYAVMASVFSRKRPKVIFTEHGRHQPDQVSLKRVVFNKIFQPFTHKYTGVAGFSKDSLVQFEKIPANLIEVIYNGIDLNRFPKKYDRQLLRQKMGFSQTDKIVGIIARLDPIKDHKTLIRAMGFLEESVPDTKLFIVGDGPIRAELEKQVSELNLNKYIKFFGTRTDVPEILMCLDLFVLPSIMEATSVTLLEAMSASVPVIASNAGGNKEIVVDGEVGRLVEVGDVSALADAMRSILLDEDKANRMGSAGRKRIEDYFTFDKMIENYKRIYLEVLGK